MTDHEYDEMMADIREGAWDSHLESMYEEQYENQYFAGDEDNPEYVEDYED
jgi:hypothetical protein